MVWIIPSYNRPKQCRELIEQMKATGISTKGILFINGCDMLAEYKKIELPAGWQFMMHDPNIGCNAPLNEIFKRFPNEPWYGCINDDEWVFTPEWDKKLIQAAGSWYVANANDGWKSPARLQSFVVCGGELIRTIGWWVLPGLWHWHGEEVFEILAAHCGLRRFCHDIKTEHRHWRNNRAVRDATYESGEVNAKQDGVIFKQWLHNDSAELVNKIIRAMYA